MMRYARRMTIAASEDYLPLVAAEVRAWTARRGLNQSRLAELLGVNQAWVSRRLTGRQMIDVGDLARFAKVLNVDVKDLLPRLDSNQQPSGYRPRKRPDLVDKTRALVVEVKNRRAA